MDDNERAAFHILMNDGTPVPTMEELHASLLELEREGLVERVSGEGVDTIWRQTEKGQARAKQILARVQN